jgi:Imm-5 like putative immunity protein
MRLDKRDHKPLALWATACAEHVLLNFEESYPMDNLPRKALEATRAWVRGGGGPYPPPPRPPMLVLTLRMLPTTL